MTTIQFVYKTESGKVESYKAIKTNNFNILIFLN